MTMNMSIMGDEIKIICSEGNHDLGGKDWDNMFMGYLEREFKAQTGFSGEFDEYAKQELRLKTEKAKQQLSGRETTKVALEADGLRALIDISRQTFDEITEPLLHQTIAITDDAIATARNKGYEINEILLVGGATKMPQVTNALKTKYGLEPKILEPDEAVAKGAAIYAVSVYIKNQEIMGAWVESEERDEEMRPLAGNYEEDLTIGPGRGTRPIHITFSTTKSYALEVLVEDPAGNEKKTKCNNLIIKNESMPNGTVRVTASFKTEVPHQTTVEMKVYESDFMDRFYEVDEYFLLGSALFDLPVQTLPKGSPVDITFSLSTEGILTLTGKDVANNLDLTCRGKNYATIEAKGFMSSEEVEKLREKSTRVMVT
jgi:molecular chaperone DnaK (HSP70)